MSASLVGSEMCIRDRNPSQAREAVLSLYPQLRASHWARHPIDLKWEPVSYTHLTLPTICSV
eukprot:7554497-Alexandrium_andersonii.AAC.1